MPLHKGKSKKVVGENIHELMHGEMSAARAKGVHTMMKKGMTEQQARQRMAVAISMEKAGKHKK